MVLSIPSPAGTLRCPYYVVGPHLWPQFYGGLGSLPHGRGGAGKRRDRSGSFMYGLVNLVCAKRTFIF